MYIVQLDICVGRIWQPLRIQYIFVCLAGICVRAGWIICERYLGILVMLLMLVYQWSMEHIHLVHQIPIHLRKKLILYLGYNFHFRHCMLHLGKLME